MIAKDVNPPIRKPTEPGTKAPAKTGCAPEQSAPVMDDVLLDDEIQSKTKRVGPVRFDPVSGCKKCKK